MNVSDIKNLKTAIKYAKAMYLTASESNTVDKVDSELIFVLETIKANKDLKEFLNSPLITKEDKKDVIQKLFSPHIGKELMDFLFILNDAGRLSIINKIAEEYNEIYNKSRGIVKPKIISAVELKSEQKEKIENKLSQKINKKIEAEYLVNKEIIGGIIIEIEDKTIDFSLKTKFDNMQKELIKGN